jgi:mRNA interferase MazF
MLYVPHQGDIIFMDFNPQIGHEQAGKRPALIISNNSYNKYTNLAIVCPITNTANAFPLHVSLDDRTDTIGVILCEHVKAVDLNARNATFKESLPVDLLQEVLERVILSIE